MSAMEDPAEPIVLGNGARPPDAAAIVPYSGDIVAVPQFRVHPDVARETLRGDVAVFQPPPLYRLNMVLKAFCDNRDFIPKEEYVKVLERFMDTEKLSHFISAELEASMLGMSRWAAERHTCRLSCLLQLSEIAVR